MRNALLVSILALMTLTLAVTGIRAEGAAAGLALAVSTDNASYELGGSIKVAVTLANRGEAAFQGNALRLETRSLLLHFLYEGKRFTYSRIVKSPFQLDEPEALTLEAGKDAAFTVELPAVGIGHYELYVEYAGSKTDYVLSPVVAFDVTPTAEKKDKLGVRFDTDLGTMVAEFRPDVSLGTVMHFATLVREKFYDGHQFFSVFKDQLAYAGDPNNNAGAGGPGYTILLETSLEPHLKGAISMMRHPNLMDSAGSQFQVVLGANAQMLQGAYALVAEIKDGLDVLDKLNSVPVDENQRNVPVNKPKTDIVIRAATLVLR